MPQFPEIDPETLAQAIKTYITSRSNSHTSQSRLGSPDYNDVIEGIADAITSLTNPSFSYLSTNDDNIVSTINQSEVTQSQGSSFTFTLQGSASVGQWVVQVSDDTVALADASSFSEGPVVGLISSFPTTSTVDVLTSGSYLYDAQLPLSFLPMTPDTTYYLSTVAGEITVTPNPPSGGFVQELGYSKTSLQLIISIQEPIGV